MVAFKRRPVFRSQEPEEKRNGQLAKYWPLMILRLGEGSNPAMARIAAFFAERGFAVELQDSRLPRERQHSSYKLIFLVGSSHDKISEMVEPNHPELTLQNRVVFADDELADFISEYASVKSRRGIITKIIEHKQEMGAFDRHVLYSPRNNWLRREVEGARRLGFPSWREMKELASEHGDQEDRRRLLLARWVPVLSFVGMLVWTVGLVARTGTVSPAALALAAAFFGLVNSLRPSVGEEE
jgi:hypothetical protein